MKDVRQFVGHDSGDFVFIQHVEQALRCADRRMLRGIPARGERIGRLLRRDIHARHRQARARDRRSTIRVQRMIRPDLLGPRRGQGYLIAVEIAGEVHPRGHDQGDHQPALAGDQFTADENDPGQGRQQ